MAGMNTTGTPQRNGTMADGSVPSPTGRTAWRTDDNGNIIAARPPHVLPKVHSIPFGSAIVATPARDRYHSDPNPQTPASGRVMDGMFAPNRRISWHGNQQDFLYNGTGRSPVPAPQAVQKWKIENGQDVRTTIMLRNIPNRMTVQELKALLDVTSFGAYDFSYLRIDFEKGTNVGYAFVNFADPMNIIPFLDHYENKCWMAGNRRMVEMSYATVQGFDCLVEKFRNSAIMSEYKDYRPKLWFTPETAAAENDVGTEMTFPTPNNPSKSQRSHDNAGAIGLYAPHSNNPARGRRSQWDRGTPSQLQEEAYHNGSPFGGFAMTRARMPFGQAPTFPLMQYREYGNQFGGFQGTYFNAHNGMLLPTQQIGYGQLDGVDPFATANFHGTYGNGAYGNGVYANNGYGNVNGGYGNGNGYGAGFGMAPNTPASRLRTHTNGRLGGRPRRVFTVGGPVQSPGGSFVDHDSGADGYGDAAGPRYFQNS